MQTLSSSPHVHQAFDKSYLKRKEKEILDYEPAEVVDIALAKLRNMGVELIEWRDMLQRRMNVPVMVKDFSYVVPDEDVERASEALTGIGLPLSTPSKVSLQTEGDFQAKGRFHKVTRAMSAFSVQHIALYPLSFSTLSFSETRKQLPYHIAHSRCESILVPTPSAVYASILRMMSQYPRSCATTYTLKSDLSELIGYHLLGLEGYLDPADDEANGVSQRLIDASHQVRSWGLDHEWRDGEEWIGDALFAVVAGTGSIDDLGST